MRFQYKFNGSKLFFFLDFLNKLYFLSNAEPHIPFWRVLNIFTVKTSLVWLAQGYNIYLLIMTIALKISGDQSYWNKNKRLIKTLNFWKPENLQIASWKKWIFGKLSFWGQLDSPCGFFKNLFSIENVNPCIFVTFNIIIRHILDNFIETLISLLFQIIEDFLLQYELFASIFRMFRHLHVSKKPMTSTHSRIRQQFFTFIIR